ncbi:hypothetical protein BC937DRAFT_94306 [Endogone sp. FLAS-F59071]|nr:hypothetical protein BC937DRAFT_94306 [Endogone sp. FLAS-F59071]|eukprot:RUS22960.1 hypothetical protein BC937DRAFT_94306 [Endogone sp. FLAS-F59071]
MSPGEAEFIPVFYARCCPHDDDISSQPDLATKAAHLLCHHTASILESHVRPAFVAQGTHPALDRRRSRKGDVKPDLSFYDKQPWKERKQGEDWDAVDVLRWCVCETEKPDIDALLPLLVPPILTIIDDWDVRYKTTGITLLRHILRQTDPALLAKMGLGDVFLEAVSTCLTYVNDPDLHIPLLRESFPCILELIHALYPTGSEKYVTLYERVLVDGVLNGLKFAGDKLVFRQVLVEQVESVYEGLGAVGVRYLKYIIPMLCETLETPFLVSPITTRSGSLSLQATAARTLGCVIAGCWPRIPRYRGVILRALAMAWRRTVARIRARREEVADAETEALRKLLKKDCELLREACGVEIEPDFAALRALDQPVFGVLLPTTS